MSAGFRHRALRVRTLFASAAAAEGVSSSLHTWWTGPAREGAKTGSR